MSAPKYCLDPDSCTYSDCPTAFCDRKDQRSLAAPSGSHPELDMTSDPDWSEWNRPTVKQSLTVQQPLKNPLELYIKSLNMRPHEHNCPHSPDGWCLKCVGNLHRKMENLQEHPMKDTKLMDWLEAKFSGTFRNSIFWGHDIDGSEMMNLDLRSQPSVIHRAKTVRGLLRLAMEHDMGDATHETV